MHQNFGPQQPTLPAVSLIQLVGLTDDDVDTDEDGDLNGTGTEIAEFEEISRKEELEDEVGELGVGISAIADVGAAVVGLPAEKAADIIHEIDFVEWILAYIGACSVDFPGTTLVDDLLLQVEDAVDLLREAIHTEDN